MTRNYPHATPVPFISYEKLVENLGASKKTEKSVQNIDSGIARSVAYAAMHPTCSRRTAQDFWTRTSDGVWPPCFRIFLKSEVEKLASERCLAIAAPGRALRFEK